MSETVGYLPATRLVTGDMRRAGCEYLSRAGVASAFDIGHEAIVRALAKMPLDYLSDEQRAALAVGQDQALKQANAEVDRLRRELIAANAEIAAMKHDHANATRRLEIEAFEAETNRLKALRHDP